MNNNLTPQQLQMQLQRAMTTISAIEVQRNSAMNAELQARVAATITENALRQQLEAAVAAAEEHKARADAAEKALASAEKVIAAADDTVRAMQEVADEAREMAPDSSEGEEANGAAAH
jgi:hypothetical protein